MMTMERTILDEGSPQYKAVTVKISHGPIRHRGKIFPQTKKGMNKVNWLVTSKITGEVLDWGTSDDYAQALKVSKKAHQRAAGKLYAIQVLRKLVRVEPIDWKKEAFCVYTEPLNLG